MFTISIKWIGKTKINCEAIEKLKVVFLNCFIIK